MLELGLGNVICVMMASAVLYLLFEYPFRKVIQYTLLPYVSHDEVLQLVYVRRKANSVKSPSAKDIDSFKNSSVKNSRNGSLMQRFGSAVSKDQD